MKDSAGKHEARTAFTLVDVLNQGAEQETALEYSDYWSPAPMEGPFLDADGREYWRDGERPDVDAMVELIALVNRLAESRITEITLRTVDSRTIHESVQKRPFYVALDSKRRETEPVFSTRAALDGVLAAQVTEERAASERASDGFHRAVPATLHAEMAREAFAWHATHPSDEVRCCARCGTYFAARYRKRARFCSDDCRKIFQAMATMPNAQFHCVLGNHDVPMQAYAGLDIEFGRPVMAGYHSSMGARTCASCVERDFRSWRNYVLPVLKNQERAAS